MQRLHGWMGRQTTGGATPSNGLSSELSRLFWLLEVLGFHFLRILCSIFSLTLTIFVILLSLGVTIECLRHDFVYCTIGLFDYDTSLRTILISTYWANSLYLCMYPCVLRSFWQKTGQSTWRDDHRARSDDFKQPLRLEWIRAVLRKVEPMQTIGTWLIFSQDMRPLRTVIKHRRLQDRDGAVAVGRNMEKGGILQGHMRFILTDEPDMINHRTAGGRNN